MSANVNNVGMHPCKVCNKELGTEKALWLHMNAHGIHHYFSSYHPSYSDQRRKHAVALPSGPQSASKDESRDSDLGSCMVLLSNGTLKPLALVLMGSSQNPKASDHPEPIRVRNQPIEPQARGKFECKACSKVFNSHQALGGHRASHKKVKGCFAANVIVANLDNDDNQDDPPPAASPTANDDLISLSSSSSKKPNKSHECSICHKVFPSGQALGGHKRCHWLPYTFPPPPPYQTATVPPPPIKFHNFLDVDESRPQNLGNPNKKPRYTIISSHPDLNHLSIAPPFPSLGMSLDISDGITNIVGPTVTFLGPMSKKTKMKTSHYFESRHCSYKCNTTLSLFNGEDSMPMEMQWKGKSSSWLHLGVTSSTTSSTSE